MAEIVSAARQRPAQGLDRSGLPLFVITGCFLVSFCLRSSLVDKVICGSICFNSLLGFLTRAMFTGSEVMFTTGEDEFAEIVQGAMTKRKITLYEWLNLSYEEQMQKLIRVAQSICQDDVNRKEGHRLPVTTIAEVELVKFEPEDIACADGTVKSVLVERTYKLTEGMQGVAKKVVGNLATVEFQLDGVQKDLDIDVGSLAETNADWEEVWEKYHQLCAME
eukprot:TRINITY_DN70634_c0_g2_i1.p1 TRINITY_DN70634_c0_g2~~TRINITY_DN70634_c0_g2_i1.p1  ORF type:complete len:235 (+),score=35.12 TRINITY_DN70634_c0_g2_i1:44-706(+)